MLDAKTLAEALGIPMDRATKWVPYLNDAMAQFHIDTPERQAAFLAQVGHESGRLVYVRELWDPIKCAWQAAYESRADLGNNQPGDGARYKGRGLIQITGRANYRACGKALGQDFEAKPELLEEPHWAALSAAWFWESHGCNQMADAASFVQITRTINGGINGLQDRIALWDTAKETLV